MKIIFAGDTASLTNTDPDRAFEGAKCYPRLESWIYRLGLIPNECLMYNTDTCLNFISALQAGAGYKVIAVGVVASKRLKRAGVPHHMITHPSGLNRKINDKNYIDRMLITCYDYISEADEKQVKS